MPVSLFCHGRIELFGRLATFLEHDCVDSSAMPTNAYIRTYTSFRCHLKPVGRQLILFLCITREKNTTKSLVEAIFILKHISWIDCLFGMAARWIRLSKFTLKNIRSEEFFLTGLTEYVFPRKHYWFQSIIFHYTDIKFCFYFLSYFLFLFSVFVCVCGGGRCVSIL